MSSLSVEAALFTLGLSEAPSCTIVQQRYHQLALEYHPDKAIVRGWSSAVATAKFQSIVAAYNVLKQRPGHLISCGGGVMRRNTSNKCVSCGNTALLMDESRCAAAGIDWAEYAGHPAGLRTCMRCKICHTSILTRAQACTFVEGLVGRESILDQLQLEGRTFRDGSETYFWRQDLDEWAARDDQAMSPLSKNTSMESVQSELMSPLSKKMSMESVQSEQSSPEKVRKFSRKGQCQSPEKVRKCLRKGHCKSPEKVRNKLRKGQCESSEKVRQLARKHDTKRAAREKKVIGHASFLKTCVVGEQLTVEEEAPEIKPAHGKRTRLRCKTYVSGEQLTVEEEAPESKLAHGKRTRRRWKEGILVGHERVF